MIQRNHYASFFLNEELSVWKNIKKKSAEKNWHQDNSKYTPEIIEYNPRTYTRCSCSALGTRFACATESLKAQMNIKVTQSPRTSHCTSAGSVPIHLQLKHTAPLTRDRSVRQKTYTVTEMQEFRHGRGSGRKKRAGIRVGVQFSICLSLQAVIWSLKATICQVIQEWGDQITMMFCMKCVICQL